MDPRSTDRGDDEWKEDLGGDEWKEDLGGDEWKENHVMTNGRKIVGTTNKEHRGDDE